MAYLRTCKIGEGGCTVSNQCLEEFLMEGCLSKTQGSKGELGKIKRGWPTFPIQRAIKDRNHDFPCVTDVAIQVLLSVSALCNLQSEGSSWSFPI